MYGLLPIAQSFCYDSFRLCLYLDMWCFMSQKNLSSCSGIFFFGSFFSHYFSIQHFGLCVHSFYILSKDNSSKGEHFLTSNSSFILSLHRFEESFYLICSSVNWLVLFCLVQSLHSSCIILQFAVVCACFPNRAIIPLSKLHSLKENIF